MRRDIQTATGDGLLKQFWFDIHVPATDPDFLVGIAITEDLGYTVHADTVSAFFITKKGDQGFPLFQLDETHNAVVWLCPVPFPISSPNQINVNLLNSLSGGDLKVELLTAKGRELNYD